MSSFIGAGLAFPVRTTASGGVALASGGQRLDEAIRLILGTAYGERPMRPEFGCGIHDLVFAQADSETAARMAYEVRASLARWEPRIDVLAVDISFDEVDSGLIYIDVTYSPRSHNDPRNLVFPFYMIPDHTREGSATP